MPSESGTSVRLQIGHVLFMDLVAYSTQLLDEQRQYQEQLNEIVRGTEQVRSAKEAGKLIRLDERSLAAQKSFLVRVQNAHQRNLG